MREFAYYKLHECRLCDALGTAMPETAHTSSFQQLTQQLLIDCLDLTFVHV